ncbi:S8 family serine peptidase [Nocardioides cynanchi]|uniref:S8 family serine peptidase n=1 Tax=Nocardioides cynanchi TaxID=2558918 RepID=UPI001781DA55|nr:S8 family serine peptidase [Nocardioides cynanchi]
MAALLPAGMSTATTAHGPRAAVRASMTAAASIADQDRNGNRVDDRLDARLAHASAGQTLRVIVTGAQAPTAKRAVGGFHVRHRLPLIDGFSASMTPAQIQALARTSGVRRIEPVTRVRALDDGTNRDFGAAAVPTDHPGVDGHGVGLCVVDTGVDPSHEQIAPRTVTFKDFVNGRTTAYDDQGHGTHVTSIAAGDGVGGSSAATFRGVAPAANLYAAKVLDSTGYGANDVVAAGVQWCASQPGVGVISMSLGDTAGGDGTDAVSLAVDAAYAAGDVVVVAAGNSGDQPGTINAPGTATGAITVGAVSDWSSPVGTDRHDDGIWLAAFSSRGPTVDGRVKPDISGPGMTVRAAQAGTVSGYVTESGTSMATPYVAGAAVLAREVAPSATPAQIRTALSSTARDVGAVGTDNEYGAGFVDVRALVSSLSGDSPVRTTAFPQQSRTVVTVPTNGAVDVPITVPSDGVGVPIGVTATIAGSPVCYFGCLYVEWTPDIDLELRDPSGTVVASSACALSGLLCGVGRQETVGYRPTVAGTYTLHVYAFTGDPNYGQGGTVAVDVSRGPAGTSSPPPPPPANLPPIADAGPDQTVLVNPRATKATFTLDGRGSSDPDGTITSYVWRRGTTTVGSGSTLTLTRKPGTYTFTLKVTDNGGLTASDTVTVTVKKA